MKKDINSLMQENNLDGMLIVGAAQHNPNMVYLTGCKHLTDAQLIIKRDATPILHYRSIERDEAAKTGLSIRDQADYPLDELFTQAGGNYLAAQALLFQHMLTDLGLDSGRVSLFGKVDAGAAYAIFSHLQKIMPSLTLVGESEENNILLQARSTKEPSEIEHIRQMGRVTTQVVANTADFLTSRHVKNNILVNSDGTPVTVGQVKRQINLWLAERDAESPEGVIFSIGYDSAVPHSSGTAGDVLRLGQTIVFDIFPCEIGGGYYYDFTRTWCLGYAPDEVQKIYSDVRSVFERILPHVAVGASCFDLQNRTAKMFEELGHPTVVTDEKTTNGYVHSLGHGVGLFVHEAPWLSRKAEQDQILLPNMITTVEPGLYYPDQGIGVRLEDTVWLRPDGSSEILAPYPYDLVLPVHE